MRHALLPKIKSILQASYPDAFNIPAKAKKTFDAYSTASLVGQTSARPFSSGFVIMIALRCQQWLSNDFVIVSLAVFGDDNVNNIKLQFSIDGLGLQSERYERI